MKQIERIQTMEQHLDKALSAIKTLEQALDQYADAQESINTLAAYLESDEWRRDFRASEAGRLPADLKCGVLSEDGIWNMLEEARELKIEMQQFVGNTEEDERPTTSHY